MRQNPLSPTLSAQLFSTRHRRGRPSTTSTPVNIIAWVMLVWWNSSRGSLIQGEIGSVHAVIIEKVRVPQPQVPVHLLSRVAAHPHRLAVLEHAHGDGLDKFDVNIQIFDAGTVHNVAEVINGERAAHGAAFPGIVHQAHVVVQGRRQEFVREFQRCQRAGPGEFVVFVLPLPVKHLGRRAEVDRQHLVDGLQALIFYAAQFFRPGLCGVGVPDLLGALAHLVVQVGVHPGRVFRALRLRHGRLGRYSILAYQTGEHGPLSTVLNRPLQQPGTVRSSRGRSAVSIIASRTKLAAPACPKTSGSSG